jgi:hypothetical protein
LSWLQALVARRQRGQFRDVVRLHRKAHAAAAEEQIERLAKRLQPVDVSEAAIVDARVLREDRLAAKLQRAHRGQHLAPRHRIERRADRRVQPAAEALDCRELFARHIAFFQRDEFRIGERALGEVREVHVAHARHGLGPSFAAAFFGGVAGVAGDRDVVLETVDRMGDGMGVRRHGGGEWRREEASERGHPPRCENRRRPLLIVIFFRSTATGCGGQVITRVHRP